MASNVKRSGFFDYLLLVLFLCIIFFNVPGMLVFGFVKANALPDIDVGQVWTFSILTSFALFFLVFTILKFVNPERSTLKIYTIICLLCVTTCLVLYFGFKVETPWRYLNYYFGR